MPGAHGALRWTGGGVAVGSFVYATLVFQQYVEQSHLPTIDPRTDAYSKCIGHFLTDMTTYVDCLERHSSKSCVLDDNRMTSMEDGHNCLGQITSVPAYTLNARVIATAHDTCYTYLKNFGECLGLAIEIDDFTPCFKREVFARVGVIVDDCKNQSGISANESVGGGFGQPGSFRMPELFKIPQGEQVQKKNRRLVETSLFFVDS